MAFAIPFLSYFQKLRLFVVKEIWNNFCCIARLFVWTQNVSQSFKILFQIANINIFFFRVSFLVDLFN